MSSHAQEISGLQEALRQGGLSRFFAQLKLDLGVTHCELFFKFKNQFLSVLPCQFFADACINEDFIILKNKSRLDIPFFVASSDALPSPLELYKQLRHFGFRGMLVDKTQSSDSVLVFALFSEKPLKLTDAYLQELRRTFQIVCKLLTKKYRSKVSRPDTSFGVNFQTSLPLPNSLLCVGLSENFEPTFWDGPFDKTFGQISNITQDFKLQPSEQIKLVRILKTVLRTKKSSCTTFTATHFSSGKTKTITAFICPYSFGKTKILGLGVASDERISSNVEILNFKISHYLVSFIQNIVKAKSLTKEIINHLFEIYQLAQPRGYVAILTLNTTFLILKSDLPDETGKERLVSVLHRNLNIITSNKEQFLIISDPEVGVICFFNIVIHSLNNLFCAYIVKEEDYESLKQLFSIISLVSSIIKSSLELWLDGVQHKRLAHIQEKLNKRLQTLYRFKNVFDLAHETLELCNLILKCKRGWIGQLNRTGSHIEGLAAFGPGLGLKIARSQIELVLRHDYLDDAIKQKKPVIVPAGSKMECSGFNNIIKELNLGLFIILPLQHYHKVEGVLILEPLDPSYSRIQRILPLLQAVTSFVASLLVTRKQDLQLFEADKMKSISVLAGGLSHYLNNLFQTIFGKLSLLKTADSSVKIDQILEYCQKGLSVVRSLGDLAAPNSLDFEFFSINELLRDNQEFFKSLIPETCQLKMNFDPDVKQIVGSKAKIQQAFLNIILNAKEATLDREQAFISIETKPVKLLSNQIDPTLPPGRYVCIQFSDNGKGMSPEEIQFCFDPFYSTKKSNSQIWPGLGLATVYSIVKAHGGAVTINSVLNQGTQVNVYLPYPLTSHLGKMNGEKLIKVFSRDERLVLELGAMLSGLGFKTQRLDLNNIQMSDSLLIDFDSLTLRERKMVDSLPNEIVFLTSNPHLLESPQDKSIKDKPIKVLKKPVSIWSLANHFSP